MRRNKETLPTQSLNILDTSSHIEQNQESWCLGDFDEDSILSHKLELDQFQTLDKLTSFSFNEIEHVCECDPDPQPCDSVPIFESMLTPVSLPNLDPFLESTLISIPIDFEIEPPVLKSHIPLMEKECEF